LANEARERVPGRRRRALLSVDTAIIACLANLLPEDVPDIIGRLCARQRRDGLARKLSVEKIKIDMAALDLESMFPRARCFVEDTKESPLI